jgi:hypothetical protein
LGSEAIVVFDANLPKPRRSNHITPEDFSEGLRFDAVLVNVPKRLRNIPKQEKDEDEIVLEWVISELIPDTHENVKSLNGVRHYFFVTKDLGFIEDSRFYEKLPDGLTNGDAKVVVLSIPSKGDSGRDLHRRKILETVIDRLNNAWNNTSPN